MKDFQNSSELAPEIVGLSAKVFLIGLSKLHSPRRKKHFEENSMF